MGKLVIATNYAGRPGGPIVAAAVLFPVATSEPRFAYLAGGRRHVEPLLRDPRRVPVSIVDLMREHVYQTTLGWAVVPSTAAPVTAMALAVSRAVERWAHRAQDLPPLRPSDIVVLVAGSQRLPNDVVRDATQRCLPRIGEWRLGAAYFLASRTTL